MEPSPKKLKTTHDSSTNHDLSSEQQLDLDPTVWQELPREMLNQVLLKLPFVALSRASLVSKECLNFVRSTALMEPLDKALYHLQPRYFYNEVFFVMWCSRTKVMALYSPSEAKWCGRLRLPSLPDRSKIVASAGGHVCIAAGDSQRRLVVCNPWTNKHTRMRAGVWRAPNLLNMFPLREILCRNSLLMSNADSCSIQVPETFPWRRLFREWPGKDRLQECSCVVVRNHIFCIVRFQSSCWLESVEIGPQRFNISVPIKLGATLPGISPARELVDYGGRLAMVALTSRNGVHGIGIWTFDVDVWVEQALLLESSAKYLLTEGVFTQYRHSWFGVGDYIVLSPWVGDIAALGFMFHIKQKTWHRITLDQEGPLHADHRLFPLQPRLDESLAIHTKLETAVVD